MSNLSVAINAWLDLDEPDLGGAVLTSLDLGVQVLTKLDEGKLEPP